jgi:hypothetical protein
MTPGDAFYNRYFTERAVPVEFFYQLHDTTLLPRLGKLDLFPSLPPIVQHFLPQRS